MTLPELGYIGLGKMGGPMTRRLLAAGHVVHVHGRSRDRLASLIEAGAVFHDTPRGVAEAAGTVFTCLTDTQAVENVVLGTNGIAHAARLDGRLVDMSTIAPDATRAMAARLRAANGWRWVDAPVSGGTVGAQAGTLAIMAGGEAADIDALDPVLGHLGRQVTHMGPVGAGQTTKLVNQIMVACGMAMIAEAAGLAARAGIDAAAVPRALAGGRADSSTLQQMWPRMLAHDYAPTGTVTSILKDIDLLRDLAREIDAPLPFTNASAELYRWLEGRGHGGEDLTALFRFFRPQAGHEPS
jgi:3-hydroxyisobutyrate dehydrogenase